MQHKTLEQKKSDFEDFSMRFKEFLIGQDIDIDDITCHSFVFRYKDNVYTLYLGDESISCKLT